MSIHYACIKPANGSAVEHSVRGGTYASQAQKILAKLSDNQSSVTADRKASYGAESVNFHVLTAAGGTIFLCIADTTYRQGLAFEFLAKLKGEYTPGKSERDTTVGLRQQTDKYNSPEADKLKKLQNEIGQVRDVMLQNLDDVMQRGEHIDNVVEKTEDLVYEADTFHASSRSLRRAMWLKNLKLIAIIVGVLLLLALIISMFACGITFEKCKKKDDKKDDKKDKEKNDSLLSSPPPPSNDEALADDVDSPQEKAETIQSIDIEAPVKPQHFQFDEEAGAFNEVDTKLTAHGGNLH